ncbi:hypothetical protein RVF83_10450 [Gordonia rubripertincta]|uniref:Secreted protein n=2 Tax=Gordonia rubripertincta TaxID=36822 RepID=A0AAW6RCU3_GORRU|nr:hypothetical protein [Gordonia rubripertincta]MDG6782612.1 hypothetical protein [Gordonia rubripertincta]NKY62125.1 hypothetical protein [Gordonia rubripertincta]TSD96312.1 hypothetical protein FOV72_11675 [Gordonia rubripertincta]GAB86724.1 hypothetical protein GORBP_081_00050 [Gordonia rubripertincta NBRC 101908]
MNTWGWIVVGVAGWCVLAAVVAVIVGRAVRLRDEKERGPRGVPDFVPGPPHGFVQHGVCIDLDSHRRSDRDDPSGDGEHQSGR